MEKLIFTNQQGESISFSNSRPFILTSVDGVGGVDTNLITSRTPYQDGLTHHDTLVNERIIVIEAGIMGESKEDMYRLRRKLHKVLNPKNKGTLIYENDYTKKSIDCIVELPPQWNKKTRRMQEFMIQLFCPNPYFQDIGTKTDFMAKWIGAFEFPLEISEETGIEMGYRESNIIMNILNNGDVACGLDIEFIALSPVSKPSIRNVTTNEFIQVDQDLNTGDKLVITTGFGRNKVKLHKADGTVENVFHYINLASTFFLLEPGDNILKYDVEENIDRLDVIVNHKPLYLGV